MTPPILSGRASSKITVGLLPPRLWRMMHPASVIPFFIQPSGIPSVVAGLCILTCDNELSRVYAAIAYKFTPSEAAETDRSRAPFPGAATNLPEKEEWERQ